MPVFFWIGDQMDRERAAPFNFEGTGAMSA
jgi:hypothetical protein